MIRTKFTKADKIRGFPNNNLGLNCFTAGFGDGYLEGLQSFKTENKKYPKHSRKYTSDKKNSVYTTVPLIREIERIKECLAQITEKDEEVSTITQNEGQVPEQAILIDMPEKDSLASLKSKVTITDLKTASEQGKDPFLGSGLRKSLGKDDELDLEFLICIPVDTPVQPLGIMDIDGKVDSYNKNDQQLEKRSTKQTNDQLREKLSTKQANDQQRDKYNKIIKKSGIRESDNGEQRLVKKATYTVFSTRGNDPLKSINETIPGLGEDRKSYANTDLTRVPSEVGNKRSSENSPLKFLFRRSCFQAQSSKRMDADENNGNYLILGNSRLKRLAKESRKCTSERGIGTTRRDLWPRGPIQARKAESVRSRLTFRRSDGNGDKCCSVEERLGYMLNNRPRRLPPLHRS